jgi:hypothetical protein
MSEERKDNLDGAWEDQELGDEEGTMAPRGDTGEIDLDIAVEASQKPVVATGRETWEKADRPDGPVGIDIGTAHIAVAQNRRDHIHVVKQVNAFFTVPQTKFTKRILQENGVTFFELDNLFFIIGYSADGFANMFAANTRRPMEGGILSPKEENGVKVITAIIDTLIQRPKKFGEIVCFGVPGQPLGGTGSVIYHESILKRCLGGLGYSPISINEGLAIVTSELADEAFSGIGISMGGGMCNVCLAYLSVPIVTYSIQKAGDYIDSMAGMSVGEPATKIKALKEQGLNLQEEPKDRITTALQIFYEDVIMTLVDSLQRVLSATDKIPKISRPLQIVLSGGTAIPGGVKELFEKSLKKVRLPLEISAVRIAEDPLHATAKGALIRAMSEGE